MVLSLIQPVGYHAGTCGYCSAPGKRSTSKSSYSLGLVASQMSSKFYQDLCDRGWRRSGDYVYHPDMERTCCPQYTIRLDAAACKPSRQQRSAVNRWNRFLRTGLKPGDEVEEAAQPMDVDGGSGNKGKGKGKGKAKTKAKPFDLATELRACQSGYPRSGEDEGVAPKHKFELQLRPAKATDETYRLYRRYQMAVHNDAPTKVTRSGFERFLCNSPLVEEKIEYTAPSASASTSSTLPKNYGSYHLLYRVDGHLVGISVIDILPHATSSVYFIWDPDWAWAGLGKLSALYEVALVREMSAAGAPGMEWVYMGYWIATCQKMRYKGEYTPSYLLDPGTNVFHALTPRLDSVLQRTRGYTPFVDIEAMSEEDVKALPDAVVHAGSGGHGDGDEGDSDDDDDDDEDAFPSPPPPGFLDPATLDAATMDWLVVLMARPEPRPVAYKVFSRMLSAVGRAKVREMVAAVGTGLIARAPGGGGSAAGWEDKAMLCFD